VRRSLGSRTLVVVIALMTIWAGFLLLERPVEQQRATVPLDWANIVWFPLIIVGLFFISRFLLRRGDPGGRQEVARHGTGEAVATGLAWGLVKAVQEYFWYDTMTIGPLISGGVVFVAVLAGNWLLSRTYRPREPYDPRR
jgi:hypothetical protein